METQATAADFSSMNKVQKLAALLIVLGPESASQLLKSFDEREIEAISLEMSRLSVIDQELQQQVLHEFADVAVQASTALLGGVNYARTTLEKSVGTFRASDILGRVAPAPVLPAAMQQIAEMDSRQLFNVLKQEQPQTIALVISYLAPERSSQLLSLLHSEMRDEVVERLATLAPTPVEVVERIVGVLCLKASGKPTRALNQTGGLKGAADLLNSLERTLSQSVLNELDKRNPDLTAQIREKMFTFEDLSLLDKASLQKILREVDTRDVAIALKSASDKLRTTLLAAVSKRAAETISEEMSFLGPLKKKEIESAQQRIIETVRHLEAAGEVDLAAVINPSRDELMA